MTTTAPFATLETRLNAAVFQHLSNADALFGGSAVSGVFTAQPAQFGPLADSRPTFQCASAAVGSDPRGQTLTVGAASYIVREYTHDGTGMCTLTLEAA